MISRYHYFKNALAVGMKGWLGMNIVWDLITNKVLVATAASWFIAQVLKVIIDGCKNGFSAERLTGGGGMPSSHSATVTGLVVSTAMVYGVGGFEFVMALFFGIIVIYDAAGVRMETGREAHVLNKFLERDREEGRASLYDGLLREKMGHTIPEILVGILLGGVIAVVVCKLLTGV